MSRVQSAKIEILKVYFDESMSEEDKIQEFIDIGDMFELTDEEKQQIYMDLLIVELE